MKGLIIKPYWADLILSGDKVWEIRNRQTHQRGKIGVIKSGSGKVFGTVDLVDCKNLSFTDYMDSRDKHCIQTGQAPYPDRAHDMWAWVLKNPVIYPNPVPYTHPQGAVIWVNLGEVN